MPEVDPAELDRRSTRDRPDDGDLPQVHAVYALAADSVDQLRDVDGSIERSIALLDDFLHEETGARLRFDTFEGRLDITFVQMDRSEDEIGPDPRLTIEAALVAAGLDRRDTIYLVYFDAPIEGLAGIAAAPPFEPPVVTPPILTASVFPADSCEALGGDDAGLWEHVALHELFHAMGAVGDCPSNPTSLHVLDPTDIMYPAAYPNYEVHVDPGRDEYWGHGRHDCPDLARSVFLSPMPEEAEAPPGWSLF